MALKALNSFLKFDSEGFFRDKTLMAIGYSDWVDYESQKTLGTKIRVMIVKDGTPYKPGRDGTVPTNKWGQFNVKVPKRVEFNGEVEIRLVNPQGVVYGDYRNELSVNADDVEIVRKK